MTGPSDLSIELAALYSQHNHGHIELAAGDKWYDLPSFIDIPGLVSKALSRIFNSGKPDVDPDLMEITFSALDNAIDIGGLGGIEYGKPNYAFAQQIRDSAAMFSARKTYAQSKELARLVVKENGHQRSWKEFQKAAETVVQDYNQNWLKVEFNTAIRAARGAKEWKQYEENMHLYPNLKYLPSRAATPREEHKAFYGIIKPITDDFWVKHIPPSAWNCLCGVEQTDDDETEGTPHGPAVDKGLDNNPGITGKLFADSHPYNDGLTGNEKDDIDQKARNYVSNRSQRSR
jgi:hypothetical protein